MTQTQTKFILTSNFFTPTVVVKLYLNTTVRMRSRICNNERMMGRSEFISVLSWNSQHRVAKFMQSSP